MASKKLTYSAVFTAVLVVIIIFAVVEALKPEKQSIDKDSAAAQTAYQDVLQKKQKNDTVYGVIMEVSPDQITMRVEEGKHHVGKTVSAAKMKTLFLQMGKKVTFLGAGGDLTKYLKPGDRVQAAMTPEALISGSGDLDLDRLVVYYIRKE